jgi:deoxyribose-phosphate aldolase
MEGELIMWTRQQVARTMDHSILKPMLTDADVVAGCRLAREYGVISVCARPTDVALVARELAGSDTRAACVIGFPHGAHRPEVKALEARLALDDGAVELDMVMNIGKFLSGDYDLVQRDIAAVVAEARPRGALVKVILETCCLSPEQVVVACKLAEATGADFVKTSTGFADGGATSETIAIMIETVGGTMGVKASGGVRSYETAVRYLDQGCKRLGVVQTKAILDAAPEA